MWDRRRGARRLDAIVFVVEYMRKGWVADAENCSDGSTSLV